MSLHEKKLKLVGIVPPRESVWITTEEFLPCFTHLGSICVPIEMGRALGFPEDGQIITLPVAVEQSEHAPIPCGVLAVIRAEDCFFGMLYRNGIQNNIQDGGGPPPRGLFIASAFRVRFENPNAEPVAISAIVEATVTEPIGMAARTG